MWLYTQQDEHKWVEIGLRNGFADWNPCVCIAYAVFWAEYDGVTQRSHWIANETPDGTNHTYQIKRQGTSSNWDAYRDFVYRGTSAYQTSSIAYEHQVGLEITRHCTPTCEVVGSWAHADTFDSYAQVLNPNTSQWYYWPYHNYWIDQPCGQGWSVPNCLNGFAYQTYEWSDNKP